MNSLQRPLHGQLSNDEMTLADLWQNFLARWRLLFAGMVVGLAATSVYLLMTPEQHEASLIIRVGQVGVAGSIQQIEPAGDVVERMRAPDFERSVLESLGWKDEVRERLFKSTFQVTTPMNKHVRVTLRSLTAEDARDAAEAALAVLEKAHRSQIGVATANNEKRLAATRAEIADTKVLVEHINLLGKSIRPNDGLEHLVWLKLTQDYQGSLRSLRRQEADLTEALRPESSVPTKAAEPVAVSAAPVYPKTRQIWALGGIGGLMVGVLLVAFSSLFGMEQERPVASTYEGGESQI